MGHGRGPLHDQHQHISVVLPASAGRRSPGPARFQLIGEGVHECERCHCPWIVRLEGQDFRHSACSWFRSFLILGAGWGGLMNSTAALIETDEAENRLPRVAVSHLDFEWLRQMKPCLLLEFSCYDF